VISARERSEWENWIGAQNGHLCMVTLTTGERLLGEFNVSDDWSMGWVTGEAVWRGPRTAKERDTHTSKSRHYLQGDEVQGFRVTSIVNLKRLNQEES